MQFDFAKLRQVFLYTKFTDFICCLNNCYTVFYYVRAVF